MLGSKLGKKVVHAHSADTTIVKMGTGLHDRLADRSQERAGRGGVKTLPVKIPGAEREALL